MQSSTNPSQDFTMLSRRWSGETLITDQTALELTRLIHRDLYGQSDLAANQPLKVVPEGDTWVVTGSKIVNSLPEGAPLDGPLQIRISKFDGHILSYLFVMPIKLPPYDATA